MRMKRQARKADHSPQSNTEVKKGWSYTSALLICLYGMHVDSLTFTFQYGIPVLEKGVLIQLVGAS